jgi:hypothetical protein
MSSVVDSLIEGNLSRLPPLLRISFVRSNKEKLENVGKERPHRFGTGRIRNIED